MASSLPHERRIRVLRTIVAKRCWILACCLLLPCAVYAARDEASLRACLAANFPRQSLALEFDLKQSGADGLHRQLKGQWYWQRQQDQQSAVLQLTAPADLAGMAYLFKGGAGQEQQVWVFLPATRKAKRISGASAAQSLFGSGLSAFDLKFLISGLQAGRLSALAVGKNGASSLWRYQPPQDPNILYDRIDLSIDETRCLPMQADLFGGVPWKRLSIDAASLGRQQDRWLIHKARLDDLREDTRTEIVFESYRFDLDLPADLFKPSRFYRTPVQAAARAAAGD